MNVQGNAQRNVQGNTQGNIQGNAQGNVSGNVIGNASGNVQGNMQSINSTVQEGTVRGHDPRGLHFDPSFGDDDICNEDFKNAHEIVSDFGSDDDTYNYSEEEDNENFGDDEDDMSIQN